MPCPHTADVLATTLMDCLTDWKIDDKLSSLTVDNCTTNDAMLEELLGKLSFSSQLLDVELFHMRCCAHILNLIVRDGLEVIGTSIERIRSCVAYWAATQKREEKFFEMVKVLNIKSNKKLILDCKTRWNSTYLMLETAMIYKEVFSHLKREYKSVPSDKDWALARVMAEKFKVFYKVTLLFYGTKYPTANLYFPNICEIRIAIDQWLVSEQREVRLMAQKMSARFDKYWTTIHGMMALATILDPRYKMHLIEYYFPLIYKDNHSSEVERIKELAIHLTHNYQLGLQASQQSSQSSISPSLRPYDLEDDDHMTSFDQFVSSKKKKDMVKSELDTYLEETLMPRTAHFDILSW